MRERSISDTLWDLGVVHERDSESTTDGCHTLYYAGRKIGRYSAHDVANLIRENGFDDASSLSENGGVK
jgi:hypothetical protein